MLCLGFRNQKRSKNVRASKTERANMRDYLIEKIEECKRKSDKYHGKYLVTQNDRYYKEYKEWFGKESAYYDCLIQFDIKQKNGELCQ